MVSNVRAVQVTLADGRATKTVVDGEGLPIPAVDEYLNVYLRALDSSPNTISSYASHLALFFRWLDIRGMDWENFEFDALLMFAQDLQDGSLPALRRIGVDRPPAPRSRSTCEAVIAAVYSFLSYWRAEGRGPQDLQLFRPGGLGGRSKHSFLAHIASRKPASERRLRIRGASAPPPRIINFDTDFELLLANAHSFRDKTLLSAMYNGGLRISQCLGLHHGDVDLARRRLRVLRRTNNANGALSKQRAEFFVDMPPRFFTLYAASLTEEQIPLGIDSDYLFVNLNQAHRGAPMKYSNALKVIKAIGHRAGVPLTPHTLRHTHGTALAKDGWTAPQIAKRLGQSFASSADVYIHLAQDDIEQRYASSQLSKEGA